MGYAVLDVHHVGDGTDRLKKKLWMGISVREEVYDLDAQKSNLRTKVFEIAGLIEGVLVTGREGRGVETVLPGVLVARLAATLAVSGVNLRGVTLGPVGVHAISIGDETGDGKESDGTTLTP